MHFFLLQVPFAVGLFQYSKPRNIKKSHVWHKDSSKVCRKKKKHRSWVYGWDQCSSIFALRFTWHDNGLPFSHGWKITGSSFAKQSLSLFPHIISETFIREVTWQCFCWKWNPTSFLIVAGFLVSMITERLVACVAGWRTSPDNRDHVLVQMRPLA